MRERLYLLLRRETTSGALIPEIDGLRFPLMLAVFLAHVNIYFGGKAPDLYASGGAGGLLSLLWEQGRNAVPVFFTISGFILTLPFAQAHLRGGAPVSWPRYYWRRVTRIEPPYFINMIVALLLILAVRGETWSDLGGHFLASMAYVHNLVFGHQSAINGVAWSLEVEIQFYMIAPLLASVFLIRSAPLRRGILLSVSAGFVVLGAVLGPETTLIRFSILGYLHFFLLGILLAEIYTVRWQTGKGRSAAWDGAGLGALVLATVALCLDRGAQWIFPAALVVGFCAVLRGAWIPRLLRNRWIAALGATSYTFYLYHYLLISALGRHTIAWTPTTSAAVNLVFQALVLGVPILVTTSVLFVVLERPFMNRRWARKLADGAGRLVRRRRDPRAATAP